MEISYKLENFEGPLDLLLKLIEKNKVSIFDIPIEVITDQYLDYVRRMEFQDLDLLSDYSPELHIKDACTVERFVFLPPLNGCVIIESHSFYL